MVWDKMLESEKVRLAADAVTTHALHKEYRHTVESLVTRLRLSNTALQLHDLQRELLLTIQRVEEEQQKRELGVDRVKVLRKEVIGRGKKAGKPKKYALWELAQEEKRHNLEVEVFKQVRRELRSVGDGLLWKAVGYDRGYMTAVADAPGEGNRHLSEPNGLQEEIGAVERLFRTGAGLAILHDLTNVGRIGDLTLVSPNKPPHALEVKRSQQRSSRIDRQRERIQEMRQFVRGLPVQSKDGYTKRLRFIDAPLHHHLEAYAEVLFEAGTKGVGAAMINDYTGVVAHYTLHTRWDFIEETKDPSQRERLYGELFDVTWKPMLDKLFRGGTSIIRWDSMEKEFSLLENRTSGAPFSIYPFQPELSAALICGYMRLFVFYNIDALAQRFREAGFEVSIDQEKVGTSQVFSHIRLFRPKLMRTGEWGGVAFRLTKPLMQQVMGEGMAFETLLDGVIKPVFRGPVEEHGATALAYKGESRVWDNLYSSSYMQPGIEVVRQNEF